MKNMLRKLFYWDAPAQGAFFALTLWAVGYYLLFSVVLVLWTNRWVDWGWLPMWDGQLAPGLWVLFVVLLIFPFYYLLLTLRFYYLLRQDRRRYFVTVGIPLWAGLLLAGYCFFGAMALPVILIGGLSYPLLLLPLLFAGKQWKIAGAAFLLWGIGTFMAWLPFDFLKTMLLDSDPCMPTKFLCDLQQFLGLSGWGWTAWFAIALLCRVEWYLMTGKLFAAWSGLKFRAVLGRGVLTLWALAILTYLTFLTMVFFARGEADRRIAILERRFGRPVTAEALGKLYYGNDRPDQGFWDNIAKLFRACDIPYPGLCGARTLVPQPENEARRQRIREHEPALLAWEKAFAADIPLMAYDFTPGKLAQRLTPQYRGMRDFLYFEQWQIAFALADGRADDAMRAYERMKKVTGALLREPGILGGLLWLAGQNTILDGVEIMLESERLSDAQLQRVAADLEQAERDLPATQEIALYSEAVEMLDLFAALGNGTYYQFQRGDIRRDTLPLRPFRFFFPQLWWYALLDQTAMAKNYNAPDFKHIPEPDFRNGKCLYLSSMFMTACQTLGQRFDAVTARLRAMRMLIAAELYRRHHGDYPETLPDMPLDPFTGQPLRYRKGPYSHFETMPPPEMNSPDAGTPMEPEVQEFTMPAVVVWSVGPDGVEGENPRGFDAKYCDDVRAIRRLGPPSPVESQKK